MKSLRVLATLTTLLALTACGEEPGDDAAGGLAFGESDVEKVEPGKADTSAEAVVLDMAFDGQLFTSNSFGSDKSLIEDQLLYTIGHLNGSQAVGRLDKVVLSDVRSEAAEGGKIVKYTASLQVAWRKRQGVPAEYAFTLPRDVSYRGLEAFTQKYSHDCVDFGAHDVTAGSMWYYFRPARSTCRLAETDVVKTTAKVTVSPVNTTGKYPEYDMVWADGVFVVVAVFGKYEDGATSATDAGIRAYNTFGREIRSFLGGRELVTEPADAPTDPGTAVPEVTYSARLDDGHRVVVYTLLVDNVRTAGRAFDERFGELSRNADLVVYNGHAGLGANIRALAGKGKWEAGQYVMVFMNGCDTYAYVDQAIFEAHARVNGDDPKGTKYADVITNGLPAFFASMADATMALVKGMTRYDSPLTYEQIFRDIDQSQIVLVSGEEDNTFVPGGGDAEPTSAWPGLSMDGDVAKNEEIRFETDTLPAGTYRFNMTGTGDADLYVRVGLAPSASEYDCRPYKGGSVEACEITLASPARILGMVRGYAATSTYDLVGEPK
ncbi:MAG: PPC domain-containing protein [Myxococcales bacterium]|nr:PPC domain-containing protein [Myxococcales bacterium]